ncbi:hypothetical protein [Halorubrum sp. SD683]|uniref:DUF7342 family protein n=1 Tax=Halorubrum sp. SD683 TaxID=1855873 RepID=UPI000A2EB182|nr:hypothetical protein [Halorubrum sp. SD683]OTF01703.1 hypothetical protein B9G49_00105 [Halorubrum sp. SD683]
MKEPRPERRADERAEPPDFDALSDPAELVRGGRTREDFLNAVLGLSAPATVSEVADRAGHGVDAAREYLEWFERMGIVTRVTESPATYERNQSYLNWRRVQRLREEYTTEELLTFLESETERVDAFVDEYGVDSPDEVSISERTTGSDRSVSAVWAELSEWRTARRHVRLLERALSPDRDDVSDRRAAV